MSTLIAVYSRTGATRALAEQLARSLGAEVEEIRTLRPIGFIAGALQSVRRAEPAIARTRDPAAFDQVIVGAPIWAGRMAAPLRTYLKQHAGRFRGLSAFCTSGSGQAYGAFFEEVEQLAGVPVRSRLSLAEKQARSRPDSWTGFLLDLQSATQAVRPSGA